MTYGPMAWPAENEECPSVGCIRHDPHQAPFECGDSIPCRNCCTRIVRNRWPYRTTRPWIHFETSNVHCTPEDLANADEMTRRLLDALNASVQGRRQNLGNMP